ncbi:2-octaprenyl-6-methoxyphenyl hydroxylase [Candidatus Erwinia haradaeae]|uniref:2-octaprenyl-6-methoxyphenol hydroxylase n=1 Tax=Candidatus Erwinia haradaeae TaxID=1922217 RepID=A0A451D4X0_9GAMM|nr:2-octaprenyl-6-methoxyphenyl hydroxylase [Candidatus Erwinia haradaeae]VFP80751.1 2-octaprenyl-6-methoxyphenol hydroxylase [Candidatus Erwinia haradaeae]
MSIIIAGGGIVGITLALAIAHETQGRQLVNLIEELDPNTRFSSNDPGRSIALSTATCKKLSDLKIWSSLEPIATKITNIHISDRGLPGSIFLSATDYNVSSLGQVVELKSALKILFIRLKETPGVSLYCPNKIAHVERTKNFVRVILDNHRTLYGALLVAADGTSSNIAKICGIKQYYIQYPQKAIVATISTQLKHKGWAFERFTTDGPLAMLPIKNGRSSLVWCQSISKAEAMYHLSDKEFLIQLQKIFGWRLGYLENTGKRKIYPLKLQIVDKNISHRLILIGNAAQTLHPVAGQGFNLGIRDVTSLIDTLKIAWKNEKDKGDSRSLQYYQKLRERDVQTTITITDGLINIFSNQKAVLVIGRTVGMAVIDHIPQLRNIIAQWTLGWLKS